WPNCVVEESTLRVHIAALRKALNDGTSGIRYIQNISGRGYRFAACVTRMEAPSFAVTRPSMLRADGAPSSITYRADTLPPPMTRILGRAQALGALASRVAQRRLVTVTGPGGIGKTTLAVSVADRLAAQYPHGVCFVDLAALTEPRLVP